MSLRSVRPAPALSASRAEALVEAADALDRHFPEQVIDASRRTEATIFLVGSVLEGLVLGTAPARRLESALTELAGLYRPLLQDDVTRHRMIEAARGLARLVEPIMAPIAWEPADGELLGDWFEGGLAQSHRKRLGQFYTPAPIVNFLLERGLEGFDPRSSTTFRLLDPACGAGHFLAPAAARMVEAYRLHRDELAASRPGECWDDDALVHRVFRDHLVGVDIDPFAARVARIRLRLVALALGAQSPPLPAIAHADALGPTGIVPGASFAAVVGNPPYGAQLEPTMMRRFQLGRGRCDSTALFIERALDLTAPGGRVAFVVPHGVTRTGAYAPCRRMLLERAHLLALLDCGQAFAGVNLEAMAFIAERRTDEPGHSVPAVDLWTMRRGPLDRLGDQDIAFYRDRPTLSIYVPGRVGTLVTRLEKLGTPLSDLCRIRRGSAISAREPAIGGGSADGLPVVRGRDISRYSPLGALPRLERKAPLFDLHVDSSLAHPRVGYQNIASTIVATLLPAGVLPLDTVNVLEPLAPLDELALLGFLNSKLAEFYFRVVIANMAQLTVHLDAPTLGSLPVLMGDPMLLAQIARALLDARRVGASALDVDQLGADLDQVVFELAGLTSAQRATILEATERKTSRRR